MYRIKVFIYKDILCNYDEKDVKEILKNNKVSNHVNACN